MHDWNVLLPLHSVCVPIRTALINFMDIYLSVYLYMCIESMWKFDFCWRMQHLTLAKIDTHMHTLTQMCGVWCVWFSSIISVSEGNMIHTTARNIWFQNMKFIFSAFQLLISLKISWFVRYVCVLKCVKMYLMIHLIEWAKRVWNSMEVLR